MAQIAIRTMSAMDVPENVQYHLSIRKEHRYDSAYLAWMDKCRRC
jgi:hypothetical protein